MTELSGEVPKEVHRFPGFTRLEDWDMAPPEVRKPTRLFPLKPIGVGTPLVEGLASYLASLATEHSISVRNLIRSELLPLTTSARLDGRVEVRQFEYWKRINGMADITREMMSALEIATGLKHFQHLSMARFAGLILPDVASAQRRWCCYCLDEFRLKGRVFEPLLWSLATVLACPFHGCDLMQTCTECSRTSMLLQNHLRPGHCPHCGAWLGRVLDRHALTSPAQDRSKVKKARLVGDVLALSEVPQSVNGESVTFTNLKNCIAAVTEGDYRAFSEICKIPVHVMWSFQKLLPKLDSLATIAVELDVPLTQFFKSEGIANMWGDVAARVSPLRRQTGLSHDAVRDCLRQALTENPPPRLCAVAKRLGFMSSDSIRRIDGDLSTKIHKRFVESVRSGVQSYKEAVPISQRVDIVGILRSELGKDKPNSLAEISRRLGYATPRQIRARYPELCKEISAKLKGHRSRRLEAERDELDRILREDPVPNLADVSNRLGYSSQTMLTQNHTELCSLIIARRKQQRTDALAATAEIIREMLQRPSFDTQEVFAVMGNQKHQRRLFRRTFPELYSQVMALAKVVLLEKRAEKIKKAQNTVKSVFDDLASCGAYVSNAEVLRRLPEGSYLWGKNVARMILKIRAETGSR